MLYIALGNLRQCYQGTLIEGEGSVPLTSLYKLIYLVSQTSFTFL
jgi:hypothetical protein